MDAQAKQQVVERVKQATNILVTVSSDPSVDQLASCVGLTLLLNKVGKHATAVFSGKIPSTIEFLQPEKTLQTNTDSLQDFIISLDKSKADKLRYKVEDQFVRIYITPYRSSITEKDLQFGLGDFNVDVVMALGVQDQSQLDAAITAHGKILHDATVISANAGGSKAPALGQIDWRDPTASSLSEMIVSISEAFGSNLLDAQMATAFLTGIVSETRRFGNDKTSPKVMTMSAQLMAAGANQQLIAKELEPPPSVQPQASPAAPAPQPSAPSLPPNRKPEATNDGTLKVKHDSEPSPYINDDNSEIRIDKEGTLLREQEFSKAQQANPPSPPAQTQGSGSEENAQTHAYLSGSPATEPAFAAGMSAETEEKFEDPLAEDHSNEPDLMTHNTNIEPPADEARNAVAQALNNAETNSPAAPPPFPPPLTPSQGVVIPPPPQNVDNNS
ncbi:MAG TPA: hypothetical protein VMT23_00980 [Candidatus Binatia bacterium]|nr:hypothetical protein [Candidatus Binatia bacterium]